MATTVINSFKEFASKLNITDRQAKIVSNCRDNVVKTIEEELSLHPKKSKLIGSYDRDTLIRYLSENDVDVMLILHYSDNSKWDNIQGVYAALNKFKDILSSKYPNTTIRVDRNAVTMTLQEFKLDIIPTFYHSDNNTFLYYTIPDTYKDTWIKTNPTAFAEKITIVNKNTDGMFVPLIKMVKAWNRNNGGYLRGFHIECMMYEHYKKYSEKYTFNSTLSVFFGNLYNYLNSAIYDPITLERVDEYLDNNSSPSTRNIVSNKVLKASTEIKKAEYKMQQGDEKEAINIWKATFGEFFPTYG